jgi:hypothetical protein
VLKMRLCQLFLKKDNKEDTSGRLEKLNEAEQSWLAEHQLTRHILAQWSTKS